MKLVNLGICIFLFVFAVCAEAQPFPCTMSEVGSVCNIDKVPWTVVKEVFERMDVCDPACKIEVVYAYRCCRCRTAEEDQQINILQIDMDTSCKRACNKNDLQAAALIAILTRNTPNFRPQAGRPGCSKTLRLLSAQCLRSRYEYPKRFVSADSLTGIENYIEDKSVPPRLVLEMCQAGGCCYQSLEICRTNDGSIVITRVSQMTGNAMAGPCGDTSINRWIEGDWIPTNDTCYFNCNYIIHTRFTQRYGTEPAEDSIAVASYDARKPSGNARLVVRSLLGVVMCIVVCDGKQLNVLLEEASRDRRLPVGKYLYEVIDQDYVKSGSFIVAP